MKQETEASLFNSVSPPDTTFSHQTSNASSPERSDAQHSVEFVHSPSHPSSKPKQKKLAEDEAFWLGVSKPELTSFSQPITTSFSFTETEIPHMSSTQPTSRLILGSSQPKRKNKQSFGRNPFQRSSQPVDTPIETPVTAPAQPTQSTQDILIDVDDDDDMEDIEIENHQINPFRNYDPSLFRWEDPSFSVGPGFFSKASTCYLLPMLNESTRRDRVLRKLEKGTLGEVLQENQNMEEDLSEDMRQFITEHSQLDPNVSSSFSLFLFKCLNSFNSHLNQH